MSGVSDPDGEHITRRELGLILDKISAEIKSLESRLTVKILLAAVAGSAIGKAVGPSVAAAIAGVGVVGWVCKVIFVSLLGHR